MQELNMGTAMVTPASASAYCSARLPKKMQKPDAIAKPISGAFSCMKAAQIQRFRFPIPEAMASAQHCIHACYCEPKVLQGCLWHSKLDF
jgi:hypothetical protein